MNEKPGIVGADSVVVVEVVVVVVDGCTSNSTSGCQNNTPERYLMFSSGDQFILTRISLVPVSRATKVQEN